PARVGCDELRSAHCRALRCERCPLRRLAHDLLSRAHRMGSRPPGPPESFRLSTIRSRHLFFWNFVCPGTSTLGAEKRLSLPHRCSVYGDDPVVADLSGSSCELPPPSQCVRVSHIAIAFPTSDMGLDRWTCSRNR